jgi:hypothetical protein
MKGEGRDEQGGKLAVAPLAVRRSHHQRRAGLNKNFLHERMVGREAQLTKRVGLEIRILIEDHHDLIQLHDDRLAMAARNHMTLKFPHLWRIERPIVIVVNFGPNLWGSATDLGVLLFI